MFLSSRKYDPGCSSRIRILNFYPISDPGYRVKKAPDPGSTKLTGIVSVTFGSSIFGQMAQKHADPQNPDPQHCLANVFEYNYGLERRSNLTMIVANVAYLLEGVELERAVFVNGGPDIVAVLGIAHLLQLTHARHVRQAQLHIRL